MENDNLETNIKKVIGSRIREERISRKLTIERLSETLGVAPSFLGSVERGERTVSVENLYKISDAFEVTTDSLIKRILPTSSRVEMFNLLLSDLNDKEFESIYEILRAVIKHHKECRKE